MRAIYKLSAVASASLFVLSVAAAQASEGEDIASKALASNKFNTFLSLARDADLLMQLTDRGPYTVYMPTDEAFAKVPKEKIEKLRWNRASLRRFILRHIVRGQLHAEQTVKRMAVQPLVGEPIKTEIVDGRGLIGGARFSIPNVYASNGVFHGIDKPLWDFDR